jgi:hypothetical protein
MNLQEEIYNFKLEIEQNNKVNLNNIIYLRLSKINNSLSNISTQINDTMQKLRSDYNKLLELYPKLKEDGFLIFIEVKSAYKDSEREEFIKMYHNFLFEDIKSVKDILENKPTNKEKNLYIASFDRLSRVFFYSLTFQLLRKLRKINIYSILEEENIYEKTYKNILEEENLKQTMFVFQLMMYSSIAGKHSEDMSHKIKKRVDKTGKITISNKTGKKWGVEKTISDKMRILIKERYKKFTAKEISEQKDIYQIKYGLKQPIPLNTILSIIQNK